MGARAVLIAAVASGQGKTTVTAALARKLVRAGRRVRVFKCGPDFIDPMVLGRASGTPVESLDLWMVGRERCARLLARAALEADDILIEGVMGLYDGTPSAADLAREFGVPVLAVIDAGAMAQTAGALVHGLRDYGPVTMAGVIANRVGSAGHAAMVKASLRDIPLFATLPKQGRSLPERHLGLVLPDEVDEVDEILDELADQLVFDTAAWDALSQVAFDAPAPEAPVAATLAGKTVAIARDAAFVFVYAANLEVMRRLGAGIVYFSPLADEPVPLGVRVHEPPDDGLGVVPELHEVVADVDGVRGGLVFPHADRGAPRAVAEDRRRLRRSDARLARHEPLRRVRLRDEDPVRLPRGLALDELLIGHFGSPCAVRRMMASDHCWATAATWMSSRCSFSGSDSASASNTSSRRMSVQVTPP